MKFEIKIIKDSVDNETIFHETSRHLDRYIFDKFFDLFINRMKYDLLAMMTDHSAIIITTIYDDLESSSVEYSKRKFMEKLSIDLTE